MTWQREPFRAHYREGIGTVKSSNSYVSYLNRVDELLVGLDEHLADFGSVQAVRALEGKSPDCFSRARPLSNCRSALHAYIAFVGHPRAIRPDVNSPPVDENDVREMLRAAKSLGARYYRATGKPLGVTGEVAELEAADRLGLTLAPARCPGYDATTPDGRRIQVKGRAVERSDRYHGRCPSIKDGGFDSVALVLMDRTTLDAIEIWEADAATIAARLDAPGSVARNQRRSLAISQFKSIARCIWKDSRP